MTANEFRTAIGEPPLRLTQSQQLAIFHRVLGWLSAGVSDGKGEQRLRLMIATEIRRSGNCGYPKGWPRCPSCGKPALDGHITCGSAGCNEMQHRLDQPAGIIITGGEL